MRLSLRFLYRPALVVMVCLLLSVQNLLAWNGVGHMTVAYVAYQQLTARTRARTASLLHKNPHYKLWLSYIPAGTSAADKKMYVFMMAATWPDEIKSKTSGYANDGNTPPNTPEATMNTGYTDMFMHKYWHFVDVPFSPDGVSPLPEPAAPNAQTQIAALRGFLASHETDTLKSYDLVWLEHLIGDVHQPLHCTSRFTTDSTGGDAGGNAVKIDVAAKNLHSYWDDLLGDGYTQDFALAVKAAQLLPVADPAAAADLKEADWVHEGFLLAQSNVYVNPPIGDGLGPFAVSSAADYGPNSLKLAQKQVALAGARLAAVLNAELK